MFKKVGVVVFVLGLSGVVLAGTIGVPIGSELPKGPGVITKDQLIEKGLRPIYITGMTEFLLEKELDSANTSNLEIEGRWYLSKISVALTEKLYPFVLLGFSDVDLTGDYGNTRIRLSGDGSFAWGLGFSYFVCEIPTYDISIGLNSFYRHSKLNGRILEPSVKVSNLDTKIEEFELALTAYKDLTIKNILIRPYLSILYADSDVNFRFTTNAGTLTYDFGAVDNHRNVGLAIGCENEPLKGLAINAEARFGTEIGITSGITLKF